MAPAVAAPHAALLGWDNVDSRSGKHHTHLDTKTWLPDALLRSCPTPRARSARGGGCPTPTWEVLMLACVPPLYNLRHVRERACKQLCRRSPPLAVVLPTCASVRQRKGLSPVVDSW